MKYGMSILMLNAVTLVFACNRGAATSVVTTRVTDTGSDSGNTASVQMTQLASGINAFGSRLYQSIIANTETDVVMSPSSITVALGMTLAGARGQTAAEMVSTLHFPGSSTALHRELGSQLQQWNAERTTYQLKVVNRLYGEQTIHWAAAFTQLTREYYASPLETVNFVANADPVRLQINEWVAAQTNNRIQNLLPPNSIDADSRMVLTNAIYFRGKWSQQFLPTNTTNQVFHAPVGDRQVPMMRQSGNFRQSEVDGVRVLEMPYTGNDFSMLIALPPVGTNLGSVESCLSGAKINQWVEALRSEHDLPIAIPKFRIEGESTRLNNYLVGMGMSLAFDRSHADFSGLTTDDRLVISHVYHKAFIEVNEEGTEAAAATAVVVATQSARSVTPFVADRPFLFFIRDSNSGVVLFMGRFTGSQLQ